MFGGLDLHGNPSVGPSWTRLAETAQSGDTSLNLEDEVTWRNGDRVVIAPTGYEASDTETRTVGEVLEDGARLSVDALRHIHLGDLPSLYLLTDLFTSCY